MAWLGKPSMQCGNGCAGNFYRYPKNTLVWPFGGMDLTRCVSPQDDVSL